MDDENMYDPRIIALSKLIEANLNFFNLMNPECTLTMELVLDRLMERAKNKKNGI